MTRGGAAPGLLHDLPLRAAERAPDAPAFGYEGRSATYGELAERSGQLACLLYALGVRRGDRVGVHAYKGIESMVGIYAAMRGGGAYVPLDPMAPPARIGRIVSDCGIEVLLSPSALSKQWQAVIDHCPRLRHVVVLDTSDAELDALSPTATNVLFHSGQSVARMEVLSPVRVIEDDLAYILYTSGSTGSPKGVMVSHRNALSFADWAASEFELTAADRVAQIAPLIFDLSTFDIFASAIAGAEVHILRSKDAMFPARLRSFLEDRRISVIYAVPSLLTMLVERGKLTQGALSSLRLVLFAGEVFPTRHLARLMRLVTDAQFANLYGPTETNVCTFHRVTHIPNDDAPPPSIGRAIDNDETIVIGEDGCEVGPGEVGELLVRGATVMQGYWGDPVRTAEVLQAPPGVLGPRDLAYRTGDLVRQEPDGTLTFLGRRDTQIKKNGYRIELGDIEAAIVQYSDVIEGAVTVVNDEVGGVRLVAHVGVRSGFDARALARHCAELLPRYMLPDDFDVMATLPKTATAKTDRVELARRAASLRRGPS